jgi:transposase
MLMTHRKLLQSKAIAIENDLRATLRNFGLKVGVVGTVKFEARIRELVENLPDLAVLVEPLLIVRRVVREQLGILHRRLLTVVRDDDVCRRPPSRSDCHWGIVASPPLALLCSTALQTANPFVGC